MKLRGMSGKFVRIYRTNEAVLVLLILQVIEWSLNLSGEKS